MNSTACFTHPRSVVTRIARFVGRLFHAQKLSACAWSPTASAAAAGPAIHSSGSDSASGYRSQRPPVRASCGGSIDIRGGGGGAASPRRNISFARLNFHLHLAATCSLCPADPRHFRIEATAVSRVTWHRQPSTPESRGRWNLRIVGRIRIGRFLQPLKHSVIARKSLRRQLRVLQVSRRHALSPIHSEC